MHFNSIHESGYVQIGGIAQWVQIRGDSVGNPVLLFLHGGPGGSAMVLGTAWRDWEKDFTIVHWDQRGAGRTFEKNGATGGKLMTIEQMSNDGLEVVEFLLKRLRAGKIIVVGHSWGTVLGVHMIRAKPQLFSAYVGVAQVTSTRRNGALRYQKLLARLQEQNDSKAVHKLEQIGPPPYGRDLSKQATFQELANLGPVDEFVPKLPRPLPPDIRPMDREIIGRGMMFSRQQIMSNGEFEHVDLFTLGSKFEVPIFIFSGTHDQTTPIELAGEYFNHIDAPQKELVRFEGEGHFFLFNEPEKFFRELLRLVGASTLGF